MCSRTILPPGNYSVFVLRDNSTWEQPTYRLKHSMDEHNFRLHAEVDCGGFISFGVGEDPDCPDENVRELPACAYPCAQDSPDTGGGTQTVGEPARDDLLATCENLLAWLEGLKNTGIVCANQDNNPIVSERGSALLNAMMNNQPEAFGLEHARTAIARARDAMS